MLTLNNVEVVYDRTILVLRGVSLEVPTGRIVALLGSNGAGKSTTLKTISGILAPERGEVTAGTVELDGVRIDNREPADIVKHGVAQVMEGRRTFQLLTTEENLVAGAHTRRDKAHVERDKDLVYEYFPRLAERRGIKAGYLSGGEQQMLAIGRGLMSSPQILLLDEPSSGLGADAGGGNFRDRAAAQSRPGHDRLAGGAKRRHGADDCPARLHHGEWPHRAG